MGTRCTNCLLEKKDKMQCDLSNNLINETIKATSQYDINSLTENQNKQHDYHNIKFLKFNPKNSQRINPIQITQLNKYIRGYLFRKEYKKYLKNKLIENSNDLYSLFLKKYSQNEKVNKILYSQNPTIINLLTLNYKDFYNENENENPIIKIENSLKTIKKYRNSLIFKYPDNKLIFNDINQCITNVESVYKGEVDLITNKKCGKGELIYRSGAQKFGTWINNEFKGWNRYIDFNGILYLGYFNNNELNGKGIKFQIEKNKLYKGDFINNIKEGYGIEESEGTKYEGEFSKDKKNGKGKILFKNGDIYEGNFENNKFNGEGHYIWKKNGHEYIGNYLNGQFNGKGFYKWSENEYYKGDYKMGIKEGNGEVKYPNGKKYIGPFVNGKLNGIGIFEDGKGNKGEVEFVNGKINKNYKMKKKYIVK